MESWRANHYITSHPDTKQTQRYRPLTGVDGVGQGLNSIEGFAGTAGGGVGLTEALLRHVDGTG